LILQGLDDLAVVESSIQPQSDARGGNRGGQFAEDVVEELTRSDGAGMLPDLSSMPRLSPL
jgi:hypothetical protein